MAIGNSTDRFNGVIASLAVKVRCVVGVEVDVPTLSGIANPYSGVNIADGDRVLLTAQTDPILNGIWDARADGVWTRAADWDGNRDVEKGSTVWAGQQTGDDKLWQCQTAGVILPGSTAVSITELLNPENIGVAGVTIEDEGVPLVTAADTLDFVGAGVVATGAGATKTITIPGATPGVNVEDEGTPLATIADTLDFVGAGVVASGVGGTKTITIAGGAGGGVVVEDEGVPLATTADTLDFVGAGVTATGAGLTKTITIPGGAGVVTEIEDGAGNIAVIGQGGGTIGIRSTGNTDAENRDLEWQYQNGTTRFSIGQEFSTAMIFRHHITGEPMIFRVGVGGGNRDRLRLDGNQSTGGVLIYAAASSVKLETIPEGAKVRNGTLFLQQQAAQEADIAGFGQLHVDSADDSLHYITEAGVDFDLTAGGGGIGGSITDNQIAVGAATADDIEGSATFLFDGSHLTVVNYEFDANQTVGAGQDNFVLTYDNVTGLISLEVAVAGAEVNDLSAAVTWVNVPDGNITVGSVTQHVPSIDHDGLLNFVAAEHIDWSVTGAEDVHTDRVPVATTTAVGGSELATTAERITGTDAARTLTPATAQRFVLVTPISISFGGDDTWATISDATLAAANATHALIKCFCQIAPTGGNFATQVIHLRETGSAIAKATSNRAAIAAGEDAPTNLDASADTNDAWVKLNANEDFDILQDQAGTGTSINQAWIIGYMA